ncbi:hypothetical protein AKJ09_07697 [Labilithrix luteola]|uniref:Aminoglycoside phosphotransferase domain-containing protein n=1 Tax=Labilithrix luteola TaxID=1391654 RepID=A0A0K1Q5N1_9BACT|nr:AAA family ATPase [Labilithrix luteola]AKV01034.1 hypothetical protein AKJ09_07697 [Labilithrix luteola]
MAPNGDTPDSRKLERDLARPEAYPLPRPGAVEVRETHISWAFLTEGDVYKVKKPIDLGFLDFSTLEKRRRACEAEVVLNERLAASVYLGVVPVHRSSDGHHHLYPDGEVVDWAVHMLRLPDECRADSLLARGQLSSVHIARLAQHIADFHARCTTSEAIAEAGSICAVTQNVRENFTSTAPAIRRFVLGDEAREIERWQLSFLARNAPRFEARQRGGFVRDGHGDLRLDHVYFDPFVSTSPAIPGQGITILDCIEFSERLRAGDVCSDIAFLSMDLIAHGRVDLAEALLAHYARASNDYDLYALVDFYESYRAYVRGKVAMLRAQASTDPRVVEDAEQAARRHFLLALAGARPALLPPVVVAVGGVIASGKSTIADALAERLGAPVVDADRTRKAMMGVASTDRLDVPAFEGPYDPRVTAEVYAELARCAGVVVRSGRSVVLDASFRTREQRAVLRTLAESLHVPLFFVECRAPAGVCRQRLERRALERGVSDGRLAIFDDFIARAESVEPGEFNEREHIAVDTTRPVETTMRALSERVRFWPRGLVA